MNQIESRQCDDAED